MTFDMTYAAHTEIYDEEATVGPDLAFLQFPPDTTASLASIMSFYALSKRADRMLTRPPPLKDGLWGLSGYPQELTADAEAASDTTRVKVFSGGIGFGVVVGEEEIASLDYIKYEALYNEFYEGPDKFGGVSGGGLWHVLVDLASEKPAIRELLLSGVAFYQTDKFASPDGPKRHIICHGRRSLYGALIERVQADSK
jgi:hypothetical protein